TGWVVVCATPASHGTTPAQGIEPIQRTFGVARHVIHGSRPETTLAIALAIVESHRLSPHLRRSDAIESASRQIEERNLRFQRYDQSTFLSDSQGADHLGHRPTLHSSCRPVVALHGR